MQPVQPPPVKNPVDLVLAKLHVALNDFFVQLPNIIGGLVIVCVGWLLARLAARAVRGAFSHRHHADLGGVLASIVFGAIVAAAMLVACVIVFPSVKPATVISSLGIGSIAIGFAFKDILQNLLAGILLLLNRPFRSGDEIVVKGFEGRVERIESRATSLRTYDGRRVVIPNSDIYTSPVTINTAFEKRRSEYDIGIGYGDDLGAACRLFTETLAGLDGVEAAPAPEALPWGVDDNAVTIRMRWWTRPERRDVVLVHARVLGALRDAAAAHRIDLPYPTRVVLLHDQTEAADGDRARQREGWPTGDVPSVPRRARAEAVATAAT